MSRKVNDVATETKTRTHRTAAPSDAAGEGVYKAALDLRAQRLTALVQAGRAAADLAVLPTGQQLAT
jgi:hypothetical protein